MPRPWDKSPGLLRGTPRNTPLPPLAPLPPVPAPPAQPAPYQSPGDGARALLQAYFHLTGGVRSGRSLVGAAKPLPPEQLTLFNPAGTRKAIAGGRARWEVPLRELAYELARAGCSGAGYVQYVITKHSRVHGRAPYAAQVFGQGAIDRWLPEYLRVGAAQVVAAATYTASPERRRAHQERTNGGSQGRERALPVHPGAAAGVVPPDPGRPRPAPPPRPTP